jgi:uncharacterized protein (DUF1697 family)
MPDWVALLRGINVGTAKRVPMAALRQVFVDAGHAEVATLLNSGNVVFRAAGDPDPEVLRRGVREATGVDCELMVVSAEAFRAVAEANPLRAEGRPGNRIAVSFPAGVIDVSVGRPAASELMPEELVVTASAVYQWLPDGVLATKVPPAWWRSLGVAVTARNDATVEKIVALLDGRASR